MTKSSSGKRPPRLGKAPGEYHHGNLRDSLLRAAERHIARTGDLELGLRELARAVGVSHAAVYRHFDSKVALQAELAQRGYEALTLALRAARTDADESSSSSTSSTSSSSSSMAHAAMRRVGLAYVQFALDSPGAFQLMFDRVLKPFTDHPALAAAASAAFTELADAVARAVAEEPDPSSPDRAAVLTHALWALVHGHATLVLDTQLVGPLGIDRSSAIAAAARAIDCLTDSRSTHPLVDSSVTHALAPLGPGTA